MGKWLKSLLLSVSYLFISTVSYSQDYQTLKSSGHLPDDFMSLMSEKFDADAAKIQTDERKQSKKIQKQFYLESNYSINEIFKSGNVLFNDAISNYLNTIYSKIQEGNPELKQENIRFYTSRSTIVNAFAMHSGVIFINVGLVAKVETEDALAYIMCHEISHFLKKHNIKQYTFNVEVDKKGNIFKSNEWEDKMFSKANYSRQQELEADSIGLVIFSKTNYNIHGAETALNCLETYNLPFKNNLNFSGTLFETDYFKLDSMIRVDVKDLKEKEKEEENPEYSTHPEINVRIDSLKSYEKSIFSKGVTELTSNAMQKTAQFELCHLYLEKGMVYHAIYCTLNLLSEYPANNYLQNIFKNALYSLAKGEAFYDYQTEESDDLDFKTKRNEYRDDLRYSSVEIQQIWKFFTRIKRKELNFIAIDEQVRWAEKNAVNNPEAGFINWDQRRIEDLLNDYFLHYSSKAKEVNPSMNYLHDNYPAFARIYDASKEKYIKENPADDEDSDFEDHKKKKKGNRKKIKIQRLIVMDPQYHVLDFRKKNSYKYMASEEALLKYEDKIKENSKIAGLDCVFLSPISMKSNEVETLNDIMLLKSFIDEEFNNSPEAISSNKEAIDELIKKYKTNKLAFMGTYSARMNKSLSKKITYLATSLIFFPLIPGSIKYAFNPEYQTYNYLIVFDLQKEKLIYSNSHLMKMSDNNGAINSAMYYNLLRIKKINYE